VKQRSAILFVHSLSHKSPDCCVISGLYACGNAADEVFRGELVQTHKLLPAQVFFIGQVRSHIVISIP